MKVSSDDDEADTANNNGEKVPSNFVLNSKKVRDCGTVTVNATVTLMEGPDGRFWVRYGLPEHITVGGVKYFPRYPTSMFFSSEGGADAVNID